MLGFFQIRTKRTQQNQPTTAEARYIKIRNIYLNYIFAVEKGDEEKFLQASPDELIGCRPLAKNGAVQKVQAVFFRRNELKLVS